MISMINAIKNAIENNEMAQFMESLEKEGKVQEVIPYLTHTVGLDQNYVDFHCYNVYRHEVAVAYAAQNRFPGNIILLASAPCHDVAKGWILEKNGVEIRKINPKNNQPQDIGHEEAGALVTYQMVRDWGFDVRTALYVEFITKYHGIRLDKSPKKTTVARQIRNFIKEFGTEEKPLFMDKKSLSEGIELLFDFMLCDADGFKPEFGEKCRDISEAVRLVFREVLKETAFFKSDLSVCEDELLDHGATEEQAQEILKKLLDLNKFQRDEVVQFVQKKYEIAL